MPSPVRDHRYPLCSAVGVLRRTNRGGLVVSTAALYEHLGWQTYRKFLPTMTHSRGNNGYVTAESCEAFLGTLNGAKP